MHILHSDFVEQAIKIYTISDSGLKTEDNRNYISTMNFVKVARVKEFWIVPMEDSDHEALLIIFDGYNIEAITYAGANNSATF